MEMIAKGLTLDELEAHAHADLLPDRIEMHRRRSTRRRIKRVRRGNVHCSATNVAGDDVFAHNRFTCTRINA